MMDQTNGGVPKIGLYRLFTRAMRNEIDRCGRIGRSIGIAYSVRNYPNNVYSAFASVLDHIVPTHKLYQTRRDTSIQRIII